MRFIPARAGNAPCRASPLAPVAVHPRACGERSTSRSRKVREVGSSPRVRGTPVTSKPAARKSRFIPARAGNAYPPGHIVFESPVHPRACGERCQFIPWPAMDGGSSPRVRGTPGCEFDDLRARRFIPARAGNAEATTKHGMCSPVHPRACGERTHAQNALCACPGSSPRVRGTHVPRPFELHHRRFIPARAGNATDRSGCRTRPAVHPRACGERSVHAIHARVFAGSSPRVRGTPEDERHICPLQRFIPARAGNAASRRCLSVSSSVHPRACGERLSSSSDDPQRCGSSPRVRGTRRHRLLFRKGQRFIPARAGNARDAWICHESSTVHPRACGERRYFFRSASL